MLLRAGDWGDGGRRVHKPVAVEGLEERVLMAMSLKAGGSGYSNLLATDSAAVRQQKLIIDPPEALAAFSACLALQPDSAWCLYNRGLAYAAAGRANRAMSDLEQALARDPDHRPARELLAGIRRK